MSLVNMVDKFDEIPIIDLKDLKSQDPADRRRIADEIRNACIQVGFFYVINHGIPEHMTESTLEMAERFFSLPIDVKMGARLSIDRKTPGFKGYWPLSSGYSSPESAGDLQEGLEFGWESLSKDDDVGKSNGPMARANVWPSEGLEGVPGFRKKVLDYYHSVVNLGKALLPIFALALDLPENFFDDKIELSAVLMKVLHYPPQTGSFDERTIGIGAHTDWQCFTILWQQPGIQALQVLNPDQKWVDAPPISGSLVINLGDQLARWTNDIFKATVHRVVNCGSVHRYSIPLFFGADRSVKLEPIPSCVSPDRPPRYEVITAGEYIQHRLQATYNH